MTRRNGRRISHKIRLPFATLADLAPVIIPKHLGQIVDAYELQPSSGLWRKNDGALTARLVYRAAREDGIQSLVLTVRNITLDCGVADA